LENLVKVYKNIFIKYSECFFVGLGQDVFKMSMELSKYYRLLF